MTWSILTPYCSAHWNGETLSIGPDASKQDLPDDDHLESYWRAYFCSIFNPARLKIDRHDIGDAEKILAKPARGWRDSGSHPHRASAHGHHGQCADFFPPNAPPVL